MSRSVQQHVEHDSHQTHHHVGSDQSNHHTVLDGAAQLARGHVGNAKGLGHRGISSRESVGVAGVAGQVAARVTPKLATDDARARRQTSLRLLRLREAAGVTQEEIGRRVGVTKRAVGSIERAEVRAVALHAFLLLLDEVIAEKGLDAALLAILTEEQRHAASREKPWAEKYSVSEQPNRLQSGAHPGHICEANISVAGGGAHVAVMPNAHNRATSKLVKGSPNAERVMASILDDATALPSARACGARATDSTPIKPARVGGVGCPVVRLTDGLTLVDAQASHLSGAEGRKARRFCDAISRVGAQSEKTSLWSSASLSAPGSQNLQPLVSVQAEHRLEPAVAPQGASVGPSRELLPVRKASSKAHGDHVDRNDETRRGDAEHPGNGGVRKTSPSIPGAAGSTASSLVSDPFEHRVTRGKDHEVPEHGLRKTALDVERGERLGRELPADPTACESSGVREQHPSVDVAISDGASTSIPATRRAA